MIVRNEEAYLDACLASLAGVCDEVVVVDTGSTDATPEIALRHGARLFHLPWRNDFSLARNHALDQARGDWILYIDADERVRPPDLVRLRADLAQTDCAALTVRFHPRTGYTAYPEQRLFRADPRIRFQGAIHETMRPGIQRVMREDGMRLGASCLVMDHVGYDGDQSGKFDRNLSLLRVQIAADPGRIYLHWHLGTVLRDMGHDAEARAAFAHGIALSRQAGAALVRGEACLCYIDLARMLDVAGEDALGLLREARARFPENLMLLWLEATILLRQGAIAAARPGLELLAGIDADGLMDELSYDARIFGPGNYAALGTAAFRAGQWADSAAWFAKAEERAGGNLEYRAKRLLAEARARRATVPT